MFSTGGALLFTLCIPLFAGGTPVAAPQSDWKFTVVGNSGILALESITVSPTLVLFLDRPENDPLEINNHSAWGALWNLETNTASPLNLVTNTFCASGALISNGSMVSLGGNAVSPFPADGDQDGRMGLRIFEPCDDPAGVGCTFFDDPATLHLAANRWYPSSVRIFDGSLFIAGGMHERTPFFNTDPENSFEFFPPKDNGVPRQSPFLARTVPANLFPRAFALPDGTIFLVANNQSIIYNIETGVETVLPDIPNGVRVTNPLDGSGILLPLSPPDYTPEVLICGGTNISDTIDPSEIDVETPASNQCNRILLTPEGIAKGWQVEFLPEGRMMPEMLHLPNGQVIIINGAQTGTAAMDSIKNPIDMGSNADHPVLTPTLYTADAPVGKRISKQGMPTTNIARMYHSSITLTGNGNFLIAGSSPHPNLTFTGRFQSELRVETLDPPFMFVDRPTLGSMPTKVGFGKTVTVPVTIPNNLKASSIQVSLMDLGFSSHAFHSSARLVFMDAKLSSDRKSLTFTTPPNPRVYPPGPAFIFLTVDDVSSVGAKVMVGSGGSPPVAE